MPSHLELMLFKSDLQCFLQLTMSGKASLAVSFLLVERLNPPPQTLKNIPQPQEDEWSKPTLWVSWGALWKCRTAPEEQGDFAAASYHEIVANEIQKQVEGALAAISDIVQRCCADLLCSHRHCAKREAVPCFTRSRTTSSFIRSARSFLERGWISTTDKYFKVSKSTPALAKEVVPERQFHNTRALYV